MHRYGVGMMLMWTMGLLIGSVGRSYAQSPQIGFIFPNGGQRGQTITVNVHGQNLQGATTVLFSSSGVTGKIAPTEDGKGLQNTKADVLPIVVTIAPDAPPGVGEVRVFGPRGVSNVGRFMVGTCPEVNEKEPNNKVSQAQTVQTPITINGQINGATDQDSFAFAAQAGQQIVFRVDAFSLNFALDSVLLLKNQQGRKLATSRNPYRFDTSLAYTFKKTGTYCIQIHDWTYRGGANYTYRLTIGATPHLTSIFPAGGRKGTQVHVTLHGVNLNGIKTQQVSVPADASPFMTIPIAVTTPQGVSNRVSFFVGDMPEGIEQEPNNTRENATRFAGLPLTINGRIDKPDDRDYLVFPGKPGERFIFEVNSRRLGSPLDSILYLYGPDGKELKVNDDGVPKSKDSRFDFTFPAEGDYTLMVRDLTHRGGERFVYRISIAPPPAPDFTLTATPDAVNVGQGSSAIVTVNCNRLNGFKGEIALKVSNPPSGIAVSPGAIRAGQNVTLLSLTAAPDAQISFAPLTIEGTATINDQPVTRRATPMEVFTRRVDNKPGQREVHTRLVGIAEQPIFLVKTAAKEIIVAQGQKTQVPVKVTRKEGFKGAINVTLGAQPGLKNINAPQVTIPADKNEGVFTINAAGNAATDTYTAFLNGNANKVSQPTPLFTLRVIKPPVTLSVNPKEPAVVQGGTVEVKVTVNRNDKFAGEVTLKFANLPKGVTGSEVKATGEQKEATLTLTAATDAEAGKKQNIVVTATTSVDGQALTLNSPALTLVVNAKK